MPMIYCGGEPTGVIISTALLEKIKEESKDVIDFHFNKDKVVWPLALLEKIKEESKGGEVTWP